MQQGLKPLEQTEFRGIFNRGNGEVVPDAFFSDALNNKFSLGAVSTRDGLHTTPSLTADNIVRAFQYKRLGETPRWIWLDNLGNLYDSLYYPTAIYQDGDFVDITVANYANRLYISPHNRIEGAAGKNLLVYEGDGTARAAAGVPPTGFTLVANNSVTSGKVESGVHLFAVAYITSSGFMTAPGDSIAQVTAGGGREVDLSGIPVSGSSTKVLLATKSIPTSLFTGNLFGYEWFFIPGDQGTVAAANTIASVSFYDADLIESADYLFDNLSVIPAGVSLLVYNGRLGVIAEDGNNYTIRLSEKGEPETFSDIDGFITVDPSDGGSGLKNAFEHRRSLILCSSDRFYASSDNDAAPNTWQVNCIEKACGAEPFAVANILDSKGLQFDRAFIADKSGLVVFEGMVVRPELSWNIEGIWKRINKAKFDLVQIVDDPTNHRMMISVPLDDATAISHILYADYSEAFTVYKTLDQNLIKWDIWTFPTAPVCIVGDKDSTTKKPVIHFALTGGNIYTMKDDLTSDFNNAITSYWKSSFKEPVAGYINHFSGLKFRCVGVGDVEIRLYSEDDVVTEDVPVITLGLTPGKDYETPINFTNERMSIRFQVNAINERYTFNSLFVWGKAAWLRRSG